MTEWHEKMPFLGMPRRVAWYRRASRKPADDKDADANGSGKADAEGKVPHDFGSAGCAHQLIPKADI